MTNTKINDLIVRLHQKTEKNKVDWETTASSNRYLTSSAEYSIIISEEGEDFFLTITDNWDDLIESIGDPELKEINPDAFNLMKSLYSLARRNARGVDKAIDEILDSLG